MGRQLAPAASQRPQAYVNVNGDVPVQAPLVAVSVMPSLAVPVIAGGVVFAGADAVTTAVSADVDWAEPAPLPAVTVTLSLEPTSAEVATYAALFVPIFEQFAPAESQRCHW